MEDYAQWFGQQLIDALGIDTTPAPGPRPDDGPQPERLLVVTLCDKCPPQLRNLDGLPLDRAQGQRLLVHGPSVAVYYLGRVKGVSWAQERYLVASEHVKRYDDGADYGNLRP